MKIDYDDVTFNDGTVEYANCGIIGIDGNLAPSEGYDGGFGPYLLKDWKPEHRRELADYMIALWTKFREVE